MAPARALRVATRGSPLARWQADRVVALLGVEAEIVVVQTEGDRRRDEPIWTMGGKGVFVKEIQEAVLDGRADVAVHSAKDLPSVTPDRLALACVPERDDPRDCMVGARLDDLPTGAVVATGSVRRRAQLANVRPDLVFAPLRGNMATRLEKARTAGAGVMAYAALRRLGVEAQADDVLDPSVMLPQVAQGALAVECRRDDDATREVLAAADDADVHAAVDAERAFLAELGGGCNLPVGALATVADGSVVLDALVASLNGHVVLRDRVHGVDPANVGTEAARRLLDDHGGRMLMDVPA